MGIEGGTYVCKVEPEKIGTERKIYNGNKSNYFHTPSNLFVYLQCVW